MNYYERHIGDYLKDTAHLSLLEHGIYTRLLDVYYTRESAIPDDQVARLIGARTKDEKDALQAVLAEFFTRTDEGWAQDRCDREILRYQDKQAKAKSSANARWNTKPPHTERNANAMRTQCERNAPNHQTPDTSNQKTVSSAKRKTRLPENFTPNETGERLCKEAGLTLTTELRKFVDHHTANGSLFLDWQAAFRTWIGKAVQFAPKGQTPTADKTDPDSRASIEAEGIAKGIGPWDESKEQWHQYKARVRPPAKVLTLDQLQKLAPKKEAA